MPSYKLSYFNARGLAEPMRLIFAYGGAEFEDFRCPFYQLPTPLPIELKERCPWGQVPLLEIDGKKLAQSMAITRYLAKQFNLVPKDNYEAALCDEYVDSIKEVLTAYYEILWEKDEAKIKVLEVEIKKSTHEKYLCKFEAIVKKNGGKFLVGKSITWADIYLTHILTNIETACDVEILKDYPSLKTLCDGVFAVPKIKAWVEKRPKTKL